MGEILSQRAHQCHCTERQQESHLSELIRHERFRAISELSSGLSHNFNNILTGVLLPAQLLRNSNHDPQVLLEVEEILNAAHRIWQLIHQLSRVVRCAHEEQMQALPINSVVLDVVQASRSYWQGPAEAEGIPVEVVTDLGAVPDIWCARKEMRDVLLQLLTNAVEAMPEGGVITLRTRTEGAWVQLSVTDTGIGMDEVIRKRAFEPFFSTKKTIGAGMGLSMAYGAMIRWGGCVRIESAPGEGSTFTLWFRSVE